MEFSPKEILKKIGETLAMLAVLGTIGTYWINTEVERRMNELASDPATNPAVVTNRIKLENLEDSVGRVETKVDKFSDKFLEYLERQARDE